MAVFIDENNTRSSKIFSRTERLFVRINRKSESYFSIISFQSEANRVYVSEINIVIFKRRN